MSVASATITSVVVDRVDCEVVGIDASAPQLADWIYTVAKMSRFTEGRPGGSAWARAVLSTYCCSLAHLGTKRVKY